MCMCARGREIHTYTTVQNGRLSKVSTEPNLTNQFETLTMKMKKCSRKKIAAFTKIKEVAVWKEVRL